MKKLTEKELKSRIKKLDKTRAGYETKLSDIEYEKNRIGFRTYK